MHARLTRLFALCMLSCAMSHVAQAALTCSASATSVVFGVYDPFAAAPRDSTGSASISCVLTFPSAATKINYTFSISAGASGSMLSRVMLSGSNQLLYNLYTSNTYTQVWGNGSGGTGAVSGSMKLGSPGDGRSGTATYTMYGRVPALQDALPGNYSDTLVLMVTF